MRETILPLRRPAAAGPLTEQPAAKLVVDPPLAEPLSQGAVIIQYRTENLRIVPVFDRKALDVSPRIGHLHVTVDGAPLIIVGLPPGPRKVESILANANHQPSERNLVEFLVPDAVGAEGDH
jgi:Family of unknown function (DUF6130)